ncbi:antiviral RADAR system adenosine triphosphatase RdrA [Pectobacterium brasiliense]|uniref:antiviral RADAR system adenosine triphosphatase RdrA n=1 Tax=Pectobacterium brasiliense TaxID=180957 RepID=UPI0006949C6F|nr:antiviral RADAR system adenosine triphosphatase RdrA [Pectobacterium brasiliense]
MEKINFNLDLTEYQSDFVSENSIVENSGLWQKAASVALADRLRAMGLTAREYKKKIKDSEDQKEKLSCYHHAIFISGTRGAGKTIFLRNIETIWNTQKKPPSDTPNLYFIDTIDPTLLHIEDNFSEVIIASIYAAVEQKIKNIANKGCHQDKFLKALKNLSNALGNKSDFEDLRGIDRIQKYRSGIHLERYFHEFLIASVEILDCDALVLPIDDLDMKIDKAFSTLDDIRCLLSCPLILPIVSGDDDLYQHTTTMEFEGILAKNEKSSNFEERKVAARNLSYAYLTKIFPLHNRLPLQPIAQLLPNLSIQYTGSKGNQEEEYKTYHEKFISLFYAFCHDAEYREDKVSSKTEWLEPGNARELVQRVRLFHPIDLENKNNPREDLWQKFKGLAEIRRKGQELTDAISYLDIIDNNNKTPEMNKKTLFLYHLISFNPFIQNTMYDWGKSDFYHIQNRCRAKVNGSENAIDSAIKIAKENIKSINTLWEMPPIEFKKFYFETESDSTIPQASPNTKKLILIYSYSDDNKRHNVLFGRAFEILFWSILAVTGNLNPSNYKELFNSILKRLHFYSYMVFDVDGIGMELASHEKGAGDDEITKGIIKWIRDNKNSLSSFNNTNLLPLLSEVFYNVFSQLHRMKADRNFNILRERFTDITIRFEYIFMNSLLCCLKTEKIMMPDVATMDPSENIRDRHNFLSKSKNLKNNIDGFLTLEEKKNYPKKSQKTPEIKHFKNIKDIEISKIGLLLEIIWKHPLFDLPYKAQTETHSCYRIKRDRMYGG